MEQFDNQIQHTQFETEFLDFWTRLETQTFPDSEIRKIVNQVVRYEEKIASGVKAWSKIFTLQLRPART